MSRLFSEFDFFLRGDDDDDGGNDAAAAATPRIRNHDEMCFAEVCAGHPGALSELTAHGVGLNERQRGICMQHLQSIAFLMLLVRR